MPAMSAFRVKADAMVVSEIRGNVVPERRSFENRPIRMGGEAPMAPPTG